MTTTRAGATKQLSRSVQIAIALALLVVGAVGGYLLGTVTNDGETGPSASEATAELSSPTAHVLDQINHDDKSVAANLCGESYQAAILGDPVVHVENTAARQLRASEFSLGSIAGNYGTVFSRLDISLNGKPSTHAAMYILSRDADRWKVCSVTLLVAQPQGS